MNSRPSGQWRDPASTNKNRLILVIVCLGTIVVAVRFANRQSSKQHFDGDRSVPVVGAPREASEYQIVQDWGPRLASADTSETPPRSAPAEFRLAPPTEATERALPFGPLLASQPQRTVSLPALSPEIIAALREQDAANQQRRVRIGIARPFDQPVLVNAAEAPVELWRTNPDGSRFWSVEIQVPGALGLRAHLESVSLPPGARVLAYDPGKPEATEPTTRERLAGETETWLAAQFAERLVVECQVPPGISPDSVSFAISGVSHIYSTFQPRDLGLAGPCHNDVSCYPAWAAAAAGTAEMLFVDDGDTFLCTGCLLNDSSPVSTVDYFLTAHHCIQDKKVASTLELFWFYQTTSCNGQAPVMTSAPRSSGGADYLAGAKGLDFTLLRLRQRPPGGVTYLGWTTAWPNTGETLACIHHPQGDFKRINFGNVTDRSENFWTVRWTSGVSEPGSSGSALLNNSQQVVGQLFGGYSSCDNSTGRDIFGRFDVAYPRMRRWIDNPPPAISNQFVAVKGFYNGLFYQTNRVLHQTSGFLSCRVTSRGAYSGYLLLAGERYPVSGKFDGAGGASRMIVRRDGDPVTLSLELSLSPGTNRITGTITNGQWRAELVAGRAVFDLANPARAYAGKYTIVIPGGTNGTIAPAGYSFGAAVVSVSGRISLSGSLADGTACRQTTAITGEGHWPLYASLYRGGGSVLGWLAFETATTNADLQGAVSWMRPAQADSELYPGGFTNVLAAIGSRYVPPASGIRRSLNASAAMLDFSVGGLATPFTNMITIGPGNRELNRGSNRVTLNISRSTGLFRGSASVPDSGDRLTFQGAILQSLNRGFGYFLGPEESGKVIFEGP